MMALTMRQRKPDLAPGFRTAPIHLESDVQADKLHLVASKKPTTSANSNPIGTTGVRGCLWRRVSGDGQLRQALPQPLHSCFRDLGSGQV